MRVHIISIGDELLIGQTINTNAAWMGKELSAVGAAIDECSVIQDKREDIENTLSLALEKGADMVLITGGLGPTKDDITKKVLADFFETTLEMDDAVLEHVKSYFVARNREMLQVNIDQALLPKDCQVLHNAKGTAPGMLFKQGDQVVVSMPGVPYEMRYIMNEHIIPYIKKNFNLNGSYYQTLHTQGIGESYLADRIEDIEDEIRGMGLGLAYLPSPGLVRLRITGRSKELDEARISDFLRRIQSRVPQYAFAIGEEQELSKVVGDVLKSKSLKVGTVESCTGGSLAFEFVKVPGSSDYFDGSILSYANEVKVNNVGVDSSLLEKNGPGAVSEEVVRQMAEGGIKKLNVNYCMATSGVAGPDGGSEDKPVGTVWIAVAGPKRTIAKKFTFGNQRDRNIRQSVLTALNLLRCELLEINIEKS